MTGTVKEDTLEQANAIYSIGLNLISDNSPLSGTNYNFDETGKILRFKYYQYTK